MLVHFIPQNSSPCPVGTGDREASLAPLCIGLVTGKKRKKLQFIHMFLIYECSTPKAQTKSPYIIQNKDLFPLPS